MAAVPTSGMMLGPHRRRRYTPENPAEEPPTNPPAESQPETVETPETESSSVTVPAELTKVADLVEWVGDDKTRAQAVLELENSKPESEVRVTLVSKLTSLVEADII